MTEIKEGRKVERRKGELSAGWRCLGIESRAGNTPYIFITNYKTAVHFPLEATYHVFHKTLLQEQVRLPSYLHNFRFCRCYCCHVVSMSVEWACHGPFIHFPDTSKHGAPMECYWQGKTEESEKNQGHFVHHKSDVDCPGPEFALPRWEAGA